MNDYPNDEIMVSRFRDWLNEARKQADSLESNNGDGDNDGNENDGAENDGAEEDLYAAGLFQLVEQFTAMRHELKLQTKSSRTLEEQNDAALEAMRQAIAEFRSVEAKESQAAQKAVEPLIETLIDLDEALRRGKAVIENARRRLLEDLAGQLQDQLDDLLRRQPLWRRWICRRWYDSVREILLQRAALGHRGVFDSLLEGYELILKRLQRAMKKEEIYRIVCLGKPADPGTMRILEVVDDPMQPPGLVVEEVRPGYYWKHKVIRFAEVRAVQGKTC